MRSAVSFYDRKKRAEFHRISRFFARRLLGLPRRDASKVLTERSISGITSELRAVRERVYAKNLGKTIRGFSHRDNAPARRSSVARDISAVTDTVPFGCRCQLYRGVTRCGWSG